jgi:predicted nucleic acid-binding protein
MERRYWDSSVFIAWIKGEHGRAPVCEEIVGMARREECLILTSAITLAEVVRPRHKGSVAMTEQENQQIVDFFANPFIRFIDFSPSLGLQSRNLQWRFGLHVRDAIHVASALAAKVDFIESYDPDFLLVDRTQVPGCPVIREPKGKPLPLFDGVEGGPAPSAAPTQSQTAPSIPATQPAAPADEQAPAKQPPSGTSKQND